MTSTGSSILIVDDDPSLRELITDLLASQGYRPVAVANGREAIAALEKERFHLVLTDLRMPGMSGERLVEECIERWPHLPLIVLTAYGSIEDALELIRKGVYDYIPKPHKEKDLLLRIARALERERLTSEITRLRKVIAQRERERIFTEDPAVQEALAKAEAVAGTDYPVVLMGESGTGKELFARFIHAKSARQGGPFVPVNSGAIPRELFESELFGHAKGAFTGASAARRGLFEEAEGGTLFLDEVAEIPQDQQVKLLRALQEGEVKRIGDNVVRRLDVRIICATNRDLAREVSERRLREDLYYRINVMPIRLPPLRERKTDLVPLARHLLEREAAAMGRSMGGFTPAAEQKILSYPWPGNVRELENRIRQALVLAGGESIDAPDLMLEDASLLRGAPQAPPVPAGDGAPAGEPASLNEARRRFEHDYLVEVLRRNRGNATAAAKEAGKHRSEFYDLLKRHKLQPADFRPGGRSA
ncbi:MAG TPA: sigma-54 dependent transcriptional regulator [Candidatus Saccharimonadales bacterium]|nr:sigma-54 dependent transcriptional regulator [Candidatus Saccharimonadales bacterium]